MFEVIVLAILIVAALGGLAIAFLPARWRQRSRRKMAGTAFPESWEECLRGHYAIYPHLPEELRERLKGYVQIFLKEKGFEPCGGLAEVTEAMRVLIAAQACLLLLGMPRPAFFPRLRTILVYPNAFRDRGRRTFDLSETDPARRHERLGESWETGSVVLAWQDVKRGAASDDDGVNVTYHEFAHQLDQAMSGADGVPELESPEDYPQWAGVWRTEYEAFLGHVNAWEARQTDIEPLLDPYGAENPAEFFAVATEGFFEFPQSLAEEHPALYAQLRRYYGLDPATW